MAPADYELALSSEPSVKDLNIVWAPETGLPAILPTKADSGVLAKYKPQDVLQEKNLVDGLYVPPLDPKKQRKLAMKNVKPTNGANWYACVALDLAPVLPFTGKGFGVCHAAWFLYVFLLWAFLCAQVQYASANNNTRSEAGLAAFGRMCFSAIS